MSQVLGGYPNDTESKGAGLKEVTVTSDSVSDKTFLDVCVHNSLIPTNYDYIVASYPTTSTEVYTYKIGGASGTTVATITVVYTDDTKAVLTSVTKA